MILANHKIKYKSKNNTYILFRKSKEIKDIEDDISNIDEDEEFTERFSITSNAFLPKKLSISEIMKKIVKKLENEA